MAYIKQASDDGTWRMDCRSKVTDLNVFFVVWALRVISLGSLSFPVSLQMLLNLRLVRLLVGCTREFEFFTFCTSIFFRIVESQIEMLSEYFLYTPDETEL